MRSRGAVLLGFEAKWPSSSARSIHMLHMFVRVRTSIVHYWTVLDSQSHVRMQQTTTLIVIDKSNKAIPRNLSPTISRPSVNDCYHKIDARGCSLKKFEQCRHNDKIAWSCQIEFLMSGLLRISWNKFNYGPRYARAVRQPFDIAVHFGHLHLAYMVYPWKTDCLRLM